MIKNLIFDLDGTIINSYPHFVEFFYEVCKKNGVEVPYDRETVYRMLKITVPQAYARLNCEDKMSYEKFYSDFVELYTGVKPLKRVFSVEKEIASDDVRIEFDLTDKGLKIFLTADTTPLRWLGVRFNATPD